MRRAQSVTEEAMEFACRTVCAATADAEGVLHDHETMLTSELMRQRITSFLIGKNFSNHLDSIVVTVPHVADCHHHGTGLLQAGLPVIIDIFPRDNETGYWGDCTRTAVNGEPSPELVRMHAAVVTARMKPSPRCRWEQLVTLFTRRPSHQSPAAATSWDCRQQMRTMGSSQCVMAPATGSGWMSTSRYCSRPAVAKSWPTRYSPSNQACTRQVRRSACRGHGCGHNSRTEKPQLPA